VTTHLVPGSREWIEKAVEGRNPGVVSIMRYFSWSHLPRPLQMYSSFICEIALQMCGTLPDSPGLTAGLRKLLEAKDCFVRAATDR
jgi:hypothetical protein